MASHHGRWGGPKRFRPYPQYKRSGVEWLGDIPAHWEMRRLKTIAFAQISNVDKKILEGQEPIRLCNYMDVYYNEHIIEGMDFMAASATPEQVRRFSLRAGDVLITKDSESWTDIAVAAVVTEDLPGVLCGYHLALIRPFPNGLEGNFLARACAAIGPRDQFQIAANGITRFGLGGDAIRNALFGIPPIEEQRAITAFLDRETARIDALLAKKERLIELLQEKRTAHISRAVTKGFDSNVSMKDSAVEWLGQIPAHWDVKRLKQITRRIDVGIAEAATHAYADEGVAILRSTNIRPNRILRDNVLRIASWFAEKNRSKYLFAGDLVTVRTGIPGTTAVVPRDLDRCQCFTMLISTPGDGQVAEFLSYFLNSGSARTYFELEGWGTAQTNISVPILQDIPIPVPPEREQRRIVEGIESAIGTIDGLVETVEAGIDCLKELRSALISAAVTGKIDVRDEVPDVDLDHPRTG